MSKAFSIGFGVAAVIIAALIWRGFVVTKGNHLDPVGKIGKVRALQVEEGQMVAVVDFNLRNDADVDLIVRKVEAEMTAADGSVVEGGVVAAPDLDKVFLYYPDIGEKFNPALKATDKLPGHQETDRMVGVRFSVPAQAWAARKGVTLRIQDKTGPVVELTETTRR